MMKPDEMIAFYREAEQVRNVNPAMVDLIFEAENINPKKASVRRCKDAVMKYQYLPADDPWCWATDEERVIAVVREKRDV